MAKKGSPDTLFERHLDDIADNSGGYYCKQCQNCIFYKHQEVWFMPNKNNLDDNECEKYPRPDGKPWSIMTDEEVCKYKVAKKK